MKRGLFAKLFVAILLTTATVIIGMAVSVHWTFRHGLESYQRQVEMKQLNRLIPVLEMAYANAGGWKSLRHNRRFWRRILREVFGDKQQPQKSFHSGKSFSRRHPPPPPEAVGLLLRLRVLDARREPVMGPPASPDEILRPLKHQGQIIGWIGLHQDNIFEDRLAQSFHAQQTRNYYLIAAMALLISTLSAWLLVRQLLNPIQRIAAGARALGGGDYQTRVQVNANDELGQLAADFNNLAHTLERNEQVRRQWIADISHELRTPLAVLRGEIEAMQDGVRAMRPENLTSLHGEVLGLGKLVNDLYDLALSDLGALDYRKEPIDLLEVLDDTVTAFRNRFAAKRMTLKNHTVGHAPVLVFADAQRLTQLFTNLLENSLRYTDDGGQLDIKVETHADRVILDFSDSAPGVPEDALDKLFERLYRVDKSRSRALGGAGLGLAICRNIVEAHEGNLSAYHASLGGLGVKVTFNKYH